MHRNTAVALSIAAMFAAVAALGFAGASAYVITSVAGGAVTISLALARHIRR
jgi:hypothetical protein